MKTFANCIIAACCLGCGLASQPDCYVGDGASSDLFFGDSVDFAFEVGIDPEYEEHVRAHAKENDEEI